MSALLCAAAPRSASADWVLTPFLGWNFSGSADVHNNTAGTSFNNQFWSTNIAQPLQPSSWFGPNMKW